MINLIALILHLEGKEPRSLSAMKELEENSEDKRILQPVEETIGAIAPSYCINEPGPASRENTES